jgi:hypothetical protein
MIVRQWGNASEVDWSKFRRLVVWYSCGAASAVAAKQALAAARESGIETVVAYCDTGSEHADTWAVWESRRYIAGITGAPCTLELKKAVRERFEREGDLQVFGFDVTEQSRAERFASNQPEVALCCPLIDSGTPKDLCFFMLQEAGIALPAMYRLGYRNNNCIGCPKGNAGYWNKIRRDFPQTFDRMAKLERELGARICQATIAGVRQRVFLDELPATAGRYSDEPPITCGLLCDQPATHPTERK